MENKILAFSSPVSGLKSNQCHLLEPEAYISLFKEWNVKLVIRLNKQLYDKKVFEKAEIKVLDLYFPDGSTPSLLIIRKFLKAID